MDNRPHLVVVEKELDFSRDREDKLIRRYADIAEIQFITEQSFLDSYFASKHRTDVLLISENTYVSLGQPQGIGRILLVPNGRFSREKWPPNITTVRKKMAEEDWFRQIDLALSQSVSQSSLRSGRAEKETKLAAVYSPIGGCGKSLTALALAQKLRKLDQKVLVVGCDPMQSFSVFLEKQEYAGEDLVSQLKNPTEDAYWTILQNIRSDGISWLCPFKKSLPGLGVGPDEWKTLCRVLSEKKDFDVIILDLGTNMTDQIVQLADLTTVMVLLTEANEIANRKLQKLLQNPSLLPRCNCILVANEYHSDGMRIARDSLFGTIAPYPTWEEAMEDPVFYRIALQITE